MLDLGTRGILTEIVVVSPVLRRPHRSRNEAPTAVRANVLENVIDARRAERAFVGADSRFK